MSGLILNPEQRVQLKFGGKGTVIELKNDTEINGYKFNKGQLVVEKDSNCTGEPYSSIKNVSYVLN